MPLSNVQINQLADELVGTDLAPELVAGRLLSSAAAEIDADLTHRLGEAADLRRCAECDVWCDGDDMADEDGICQDCMEQVNDDVDTDLDDDDEEEESDGDTGEYVVG